jgi:pSer/pThr/pTyr-binding forkhead associated (FHA) protein
LQGFGLSGANVTQKLYVRDLASTHGTFVNGQRISRMVAKRIKRGDEISFGRTIEDANSESSILLTIDEL